MLGDLTGDLGDGGDDPGDLKGYDLNLVQQTYTVIILGGG